jgi:hypothetical protein
MILFFYLAYLHLRHLHLRHLYLDLFLYLASFPGQLVHLLLVHLAPLL